MKNDINNIIAKELSGVADKKEIKVLRDWYKAKKSNRAAYNLIRLNWVQGDLDIGDSRQRVFDNLSKKIVTKHETKVKAITNETTYSWKYWAKIAAILVIVAGISFIFYRTYQGGSDKPIARITRLVKDTPKGVKRQIMLPDGTNVWLNSESKIKYPSDFSDSIRIVELIGEAYFEVVKDEKKPFLVKSGDLTTTAIGTAFNVNAFSDENEITVSLMEGKVKVALSSGKEAVYLNPGYAAVLSKETVTLDTRSFDMDIDLAWKNGILVFKDADENTVFNKFESWYGVDITVVNQSPQKWNLTAKFDNENLKNALNILSIKMKFDYKIEGKKIYVKYLTQ